MCNHFIRFILLFLCVLSSIKNNAQETETLRIHVGEPVIIKPPTTSFSSYPDLFHSTWNVISQNPSNNIIWMFQSDELAIFKALKPGTAKITCVSIYYDHSKLNDKMYYAHYRYENKGWIITIEDNSNSTGTPIGIESSCPNSNHPHVIDLGLPSGSLWACCNVGATEPKDFGGHYAWGETSAKSIYRWSNYKWGTSETSLTKYCTLSKFGKVDGLTTLEESDDVACVKWGPSWCMPKYKQILELYQNCTYDWVSLNGVKGGKFTGPNGESIFLPAANDRNTYDLDFSDEGFYQSSTLYTENQGRNHFLNIESAKPLLGFGSRANGRSVRPVVNIETSLKVSNITLNTTSVSMKEGDLLQIQATISPENATYKSIEWVSDNESVATVNCLGWVAAMSAGSATITCKSNDGSGVYARCNVTVQEQATNGIRINEANFPDKNFRDFLMNGLYDYTCNADSDYDPGSIVISYNPSYGKDGVLTEDEIEKITKLDLSNGYTFTNNDGSVTYCFNITISNLKGIEFFTALKVLDCQGIQLENVNLSKNVALEKLDCSKNKLSRLDLSNLSHLTDLSCNNNELTYLTMPNSTRLKIVRLQNNRLNGSSMDAFIASLPSVSGGRLKVLNLSEYNEQDEMNEMTTLQVSAAKSKGWTPYYYYDCPIITGGNGDEFRCWNEYSGSTPHDNSGIEINSTNFPDANFYNYVQSLSGGYSYLNSSLLATITKIDVNNMNIRDLTGIEHFTSLIRLDCDGNQITSLDLSNNTKLETLSCRSNRLTSLILPKSLAALYCSNNNLMSLNLTGYFNLELLYCQMNQLTSLTVSGLSKLGVINCYNNMLRSLNLRGCTELFEISCFSNQISGSNMDALINSIDSQKNGKFIVHNNIDSNEGNRMTTDQVATARDKGWIPLLGRVHNDGNGPDGGFIGLDALYEGEDDGIDIDEANFPDTNFRNYLLRLSIGQDKKLSDEEISKTTHLSMTNKDIENLKGIEYFTALEELHVSNNYLSTIDLSKNTRLKRIDCSVNEIYGSGMVAFISNLPTTTNGELYVYNMAFNRERNTITASQVREAQLKGWTVWYLTGSGWGPYTNFVFITGITIIPSSSSTLYVGGSLQLTANITPSNATINNVVWSSSDTDIATVSNTGLVTAISAGTVTINARANDGSGVVARFVITIMLPLPDVKVTDIILSDSEIELECIYDETTGTHTPGEPKQLTATVFPENATNKDVTWSSSNYKCVTVSNTGLVTPVSAGEATITCRANDGSGTYAECYVTVSLKQKYDQVYFITINESQYGSVTCEKNTAAAGEEIRLDIVENEGCEFESISIRDDAGKDVSYTKKGGNIGKLHVPCYVLFTMPESNVTVSASFKQLVLPQQYYIHINETQHGTITCNVVEYYYDFDGHPIESMLHKRTIALAGETIRLYVEEDDGYELTNLNIRDESGQDVSYSLKNSSISSSGVLREKKYAEFTMPASDVFVTVSFEPKTSDIKVTSISLSDTNIELFDAIDDDTGFRCRTELTATVYPTNATNKSVTWSSDNEKVAIVTSYQSSCMIESQGVGTATITCRANDGSGVYATCKVTVKEPEKLQIAATPEGGEVEFGTKVFLNTYTVSGVPITDSEIFYTLDGSMPTWSNSSRYNKSQGIVINESCTLKAYASHKWYNNSNVLTTNYTIKSVPETYYYIGSRNDWNTADTSYPFTKQGDGKTWKLTMPCTEKRGSWSDEADEFKIGTAASLIDGWDADVYGADNSRALSGTMTKKYGPNFSVPFIEGMYSYTVSIVPSTMHYEIVVNTPSGFVTITAKSCNREYGDANPTFEYTVSGGTLTGTPKLTCSATKSSDVGTYTITVEKGTVQGNVTLVNGTLTVTQAPLTISVGDYTRQEGEDNPTFKITYSGWKNGDTESVLTTKPTISCSATKNSPAGTYPITVSGGKAKNYSLSYQSGTLTVTKKTPTTYTVRTSSVGYATFYDSQSAYTLPNGLAAQVVTGVTNGKLTYKTIADGSVSGVVPKGTAVMLKSDSQHSGSYTLTSTNSSVTYSGTNLLHGNDEATTTTGDGYHYKLTYGNRGSSLSDVFGWYWGASNGGSFRMDGHKAWLVLPKSADTRAYTVDGEPTAIDDVETPDAWADSPLYDLQGRRISQLTKKGIYLKDGKKIVNK